MSLITPSKQKSVLECPERKLNSEKKNTNNYDNGNEDDRYSNNYNTNFLVMQYCSLLSKL